VGGYADNWRRSGIRVGQPAHSASVHTAVSETPAETKIELPEPPATGLRRTRTARSTGVASTPTDVQLKEDSPSTPPNPKGTVSRQQKALYWIELATAENALFGV